MEFKEIKRENGEATIEYQMDFEEFVPFLEKVYKREKGKFTIPGFRKGKAPRALIERHYGEDIFYDDALNTMIPDLYDRSIEELDLTPVAQPHFSMEKLDKEEGIVLSAIVTLYPEVKLGQYKNLSVEAMDIQVSQEEVLEVLHEEAGKNARLVPVELAQEGDIVTIDFVGSMDGEEFEGGRAEDLELHLGSGEFIPGFEEQLIGKTAGEAEVNVTFPEDYGEESLAGKEAHFALVIKDIKRKELPEIDDELASELSEFESLEEYKADIKAKLEEDKKHRAENKKVEDALIQAIENMEVELPKAMVEEGVDRKVQEMDLELRQQGFSLEQFLEMTGESPEDFRSHYKPKVELDIKREILLDAIMKEEDFQISEEEIDEFIKEQCELHKMEEEELRKIYSQDDYSYLKQSMMMDKAQKIILDTVEVA